MSGIPAPSAVPRTDINRLRVRFRFRHARKKGPWSWGKLSRSDQEKVCRKLKEFSRYQLHQFRSCGAKLRKWNKQLPSKPDGLSEDINDQLADYFKIDQTIRVFGYLTGREFLVIWISGGHKHD